LKLLLFLKRELPFRFQRDYPLRHFPPKLHRFYDILIGWSTPHLSSINFFFPPTPPRPGCPFFPQPTPPFPHAPFRPLLVLHILALFYIDDTSPWFLHLPFPPVVLIIRFLLDLVFPSPMCSSSPSSPLPAEAVVRFSPLSAYPSRESL